MSFKIELDKKSYYDFILTDDCRSFNRDISEYKLFHINVTEDLCDNIGKKLTEDVLIENISLTGYDNFFIPENMGGEDEIVKYQYVSGDTFCLHTVSGYTKNLSYEIIENVGYNQLKGGFYQGAFKLFGYPVEFFQNRMRKGWTVNLMLYTSTGTTQETTLNDIFDNSGFIFYLGTRAENKFSELTDVEVNKLTEKYSFEFKDSGGEYTFDYFTLNDEPYTGYFNYKDGIPYSGRVFSEESQKLVINNKYKDIINNAFGVRITPDGRIGYRTIYPTNPCYIGEIQNVNDIDNKSFVDFTSECDPFTTEKIITKYFTIEDSYTKKSVMNQFNSEYTLISIIFERDFIYDNKCSLKYGEYRKGVLSINVNGFNVFKKEEFNEIIPHELDIESKYQEGVPFNISYGGGTQGLYEAIYLDDTKEIDDILSKFFAGTYMGGVSFIEMYSIPLYITEIRNYMEKNLKNYNIYQPKGGRRVFIKKI